VNARIRRSIELWWSGGGGASGRVLDAVLRPAEMMFRVGVRLRDRAYTRGWIGSARAPIPVLSVGNLSVGGEGKTPVAAWIARELQLAGGRVAVAVRGYGADEVLVHGELNPAVPVYAARRRVGAVERAAAEGRTVVVLDDGFQHRALRRDLDVVVVAAERWADAPRLLPRGPWRESFSALRRADVVLVTRKWVGEQAAERVRRRAAELAPGALIASCSLEIAAVSLHGAATGRRAAGEWLGKREVLAVAAIGDPGAFARQLEAFGASVELLAYPDHHPFSADDARKICRRLGGRPLVMTLKDAVKLRPILRRGTTVAVAEQEVRFENGEEEFRKMLRRALIR
jgi:tetraacyldisaccharide 4'-kinase